MAIENPAKLRELLSFETLRAKPGSLFGPGPVNWKLLRR